MSFILPQDAEARAQSFPRLSTATKKQLLENVRAKAPEEQSMAIETILRQSGAASEFFQHVLGHENDKRVTHNKRLNPIHTK